MGISINASALEESSPRRWMRGPAGWRGPGKGGSPAGARRRRGGRFLTTTRATGSKGEEAVGASVSLLSWLLKSGVPRDGAVRGRDVLPQGRRGAGGGVVWGGFPCVPASLREDPAGGGAGCGDGTNHPHVASEVHRVPDRRPRREDGLAWASRVEETAGGIRLEWRKQGADTVGSAVLVLTPSLATSPCAVPVSTTPAPPDRPRRQSTPWWPGSSGSGTCSG